MVADALSRRAPELHALSAPTFHIFAELRDELQRDEDLRRLRDTIVDTRGEPWQVHEGLILHGSRVFIPASSRALPTVLQLAHTKGHEGIQKTLQRLRLDFFIDNDHRVVRDFVRACATCQRNKTETLHPAGLLQPLAVPTAVWADISLDFVEGLLKVNGKSVILMVVNRFSKYAHFIALGHPYTASTVARAFFNEIVRPHGFPESIVSDRDPCSQGTYGGISSNWCR